MKRQIFLSFRPEYFRPLLYCLKKYEYRKRFCKEATTAYLYLSSPIQKVIGILELGVPIQIRDVLAHYPDHEGLTKRAQKMLEGGEQLAIPIESLQLYVNPIPLTRVQEIDPHFRAPQCYLNMMNFPSVQEMLQSQEMYDLEFQHDHTELYEEDFCRFCRDMEMTEEFQEKDEAYLLNPKYKAIECGYINKKFYSRRHL